MPRLRRKLLPSTSIQAKDEESPFCGFCLSKTVLPINLKTCKHFLLFNKLFLTKQKVALEMNHICVNCHTMLKKISDFNEMILETQDVLRGKINLLNRKTYYNLNFSTPIHASYESDEIEIGLEPDISNLDPIVNENQPDDLFCDTEDKQSVDNGGTLYDFNNFINTDAPEFICLNNGVQLPVISKTLIGKTLLLLKSSVDKVQVITLTLKELLDENRKKTESLRYNMLYPFKCMECVIGFKLENMYNIHMRNHTIMPDEVYGHLICDVCLCVLPTEHSETHYMKHFTRYQCSECDKVYSSRVSATTHFNENHKTKIHKCTSTIQQASPGDNIKSECPVCKKMFPSKSLQKHMYNVHNSHKNDKSYCVECNQFFKNFTNLKQHYLNHKNHVDQRVQCDYCGDKFKTKPSVSLHINRLHNPRDKYICKYCNKRFSIPRFLKMHIDSVHLKLRPNKVYSCDFCGKGFTVKKYLTDHIRCHTGERPYKCEICDATFKQNGSLHTHIKRVHAKGIRKS